MAEETTIQDPQPPYIDRVYSALKDNLRGFNKTPQQFAVAMKDSVYASKAYTALKDNLQGFDKSPDEFYQQVGVRKAATAPSSPNTFQGSSQDLLLSPVLPQARQEVEQRQQQDLVQQQQKATAFSNRLKEVYDNAEPALKKEIGKIQGLPLKKETVSATPQDEVDHMNYMNSTLGKVVTPLAYLGSKASHGAIQIAKGLAHIANLSQNPASLGLPDPTDEAFAKADKVANLGLTEGDISNIENGSSKGNHALSALGMLAEFAPAIAGGEAASGTKLPAALMYLQGVGAGKDAADKIQGLNPLAKEALIQGSGVVNLALTDLGSNIFGKGVSSAVKDKVVAGIAADAIKESAGKQLTADSFKALLENKAASFAEKFERAPMEALKHYTDAAKTFAKLDVGNFAVHKAVDKIQESNGDQPVFNENAGTLAENLNRSMTEAVPMFGTLGSLGAASKLFPNSSYENDVVKSVMNDPSPENVDAIKQQIHDHGFGDQQEQKWTPEEMDATFQHVDKIAQAAKSIPATLPENKRSKAIGLVVDRNALQDELKAAQEAKTALDPSIKDLPTAKEEYLTNKIEQANDKLRDIVTGNRTTYSKGVEDKEQDKFFKTTDGAKEEITPSRYELERTEREAKQNEQTQPNTEIPAEQPADETSSVSKTADTNDETTKNSPINSTENGKDEMGGKPNGSKNGQSGNESDGSEKITTESGKSGDEENDVKASNEKEKVSNSGEAKAEPDAIRQKAIDAITHGIVGDGERPKGDTSPRFDLGMNAKEQKRAIRDITNGDYESAAAKKMIDKVSEFEIKGEYPIIEGLGGGSVRNRYATPDDIQQHIDDAKQFKLAKEQDIEANNQGLKDLGITHQDIQDYENYRNAGEPGTIPDNGRTTENAPNNVQHTENDKTASVPQGTGGEAAQGVEAKPGGEVKAGDPLRVFADKVRQGKINKLGGFRASTGFDAVWDTSLEVVAKSIEGGAKIADAIEAGLKHIRSTDWYKSLNNKDEFDQQYKDHLSNEYAEVEKAQPAKNETNESVAKELGLEVDKSATGKRTNKAIETEASEAIAKGYDTPQLVGKILNDGHAATDVEVAILAKYRDAKYDEIKAQNERLATDGATMPKKQFEAMTAANDASLNEMQDVVQAIRKTGSLTGSALRARQLDLEKEFSLGNMIAQKRQALGSEKLSPEELSSVTKKFTELEETQKALEARLKKVEDENAKLKAEQVVKRASVNRRAGTKAELAAERSKIFDSIRDDFKKIRQSGQAMSDVPYRRELAAVAKHMPALLRNLAQEGVVRIEDVVDNIYTALKSDLPDITPRDVTDLIAGKYNEVKPTRSELQDNIRSLRMQAKLIAQIEDAEKGIKQTDKPSVAKEKNEKVEALKQRLKELTKEEGPSKEEQSLANLKKRLQDNIDKISRKIAEGDFAKEEPKKPVTPDAEALALRRKYDRIKNDFDIEVAKDALKQRSKTEKLKDDLLNIASLPRALKASLDFSAVLRQGLFASVGHPKEAVAAFKEMFKQTFSEKRYKNWISDLKHSEYYDLMKNSDLYLSDKNDPKIIAREEEFTSNLADKLPLLGDGFLLKELPFLGKKLEGTKAGEHKVGTIGKLNLNTGAIGASERAYTGYLNVLRAGVFENQARELIKRGYTFENNPEVFKGVAKVVNVLTGRGDVPEFLGGKTPKVLSNVLFSPRFMAARIQTLYLWADPRLPREAKIMAAKDIGATLGMAITLYSLASINGYTVILDPRSTNFMKIQDKGANGVTYYDLTGGLAQYVRLLSQIASGNKVSANGKITDLSAKRGAKNPFGETRGDVELQFLRGKLSPVIGGAINLQEGKDVVGQPYNLWPQVPLEFVPLPYSDVSEAYQVGGIKNALKVLIPSQFGISVSSYNPNAKKK